MSETETVALIAAGAGLTGALIGGVVSGLTAWFQQRAQTRRELVALAATIELEQLKVVVGAVNAGISGLTIGDSAKAIVSHYKLLDALARKGADHESVAKLLAGGEAALEARRKSAP